MLIELTKDLFINIYLRNLKKELRKRKVKFAYFGHYHIPYQEKKFRIVGTFYRNYWIETNRFLILADVHLGRFNYSKHQLEKLTKLLKKRKKIILLGDFFDFWYTKAKKIEETFPNILDIVEKRNNKGELIYIKGNHDWNIEKHFNIEAVDLHYEEKGNIFLTHSHFQDPLYTLMPIKIYSLAYLYLGEKTNFLSRLDHFLNKKFLKLE